MTELPPGLAPEGLGRAQAAEFCGLSSNTFGRAVEDGLLPVAIRFGPKGGKFIWTAASLRAALEKLVETNARDNVHRGGWADVGKDALRR